VGLLGEDRSQEFTKDKISEMVPEYNLEQRQEVHAGIEKFKEELKAAKEKAKRTNVETLDATSVQNSPKALVAVATKGGGVVNQHFGHAKEFQIYEVDGNEARFVGHRKIDHFCQSGYGEKATLEKIIEVIADCKAVLVSKMGESPKEKLQQAGIQTVEAYDVIEKVALEFYEQWVKC